MRVTEPSPITWEGVPFIMDIVITQFLTILFLLLLLFYLLKKIKKNDENNNNNNNNNNNGKTSKMKWMKNELKFGLRATWLEVLGFN